MPEKPKTYYRGGEVAAVARTGGYLPPWLSGLLLLVLLAGCAVGPDYKRPPLAVPSNFRDGPASPPTNSLADLPWWQVFNDDTLQALVRMGLTNSYDIRVAITRVEQAQAILEQNRAAFFPSLNYQGTLGRGKNAIGGTPVSTSGQTVDAILLAGNASWEVDLWGRIRRLNESARAQFLASEEAQRDVLISVISQVAQAYFELLALDRQLEIAQRTTNSFAESLRIFSQRLEGGIVSRLETARAEAALAATAATVPDLQRRIIIQENLINNLVGRNPAPVPRNRTLLQQQVPPEIPAGLPSTLVQRRPDVRQVEQLLRSANAQVGAAVADFFPRLSLTALFGQTSPELAAFTSGGANAWSAAANLTGPIFQGGRLVGQYRQTKAVREEYVLRFQSTVNNAFQEVSDNLTTIRTLAEVRVHQARAVQAYQDAVQVSMQRYVAGRAGYFELLEAQQQLFPAENSLVNVQLNQLLAVVQLYRALGGGFGPEEIAIANRRSEKKK